MSDYIAYILMTVVLVILAFLIIMEAILPC